MNVIFDFSVGDLSKILINKDNDIIDKGKPQEFEGERRYKYETS